MTRSVRPSAQVIEYAKRLAPEPRRAIKHALTELRQERGDIRALEGNLSGYYRLRVGRRRIILAYAADGAIDAIFLEERQLIYEIFEAQFIKRLKSWPNRQFGFKRKLHRIGERRIRAQLPAGAKKSGMAAD
jgi:mRNA interferase RelE/StbE